MTDRKLQCTVKMTIKFNVEANKLFQLPTFNTVAPDYLLTIIMTIITDNNYHKMFSKFGLN